MSHTTLIDAATLQALLRAEPAPVLLDCGFDLGDTAAGERAYAAGHLPGAHHAHLDRDLSGEKTGVNGRHPLPARAALAASMGRWGIVPGVQVVCLDDQGGVYASRAWWLLRWLGHDAEVAVLDGGPAAWRRCGRQPSSTAVQNAPSGPSRPTPPRPPAMPTVDAATLLAQPGHSLPHPGRARWRSVSAVRWSRSTPVAGHIPGATLPLLQGQPRRRRPLQAAQRSCAPSSRR